MAEETEHDVRWLVEFPGYAPPAEFADAPQRFWSGEGDLSLAVQGGAARTWTGTTVGGTALVLAAPIENTRHGAPARATVRVLVGRDADTLRALIVRGDPGPLTVKVHLIRRETGSGDAWIRIPRTRTGRLSSGGFVGGAYEFEIESWSGDVDRQTPLIWSDTTQKARHAGDEFFGFAADLAQGRDIRWGS